jgi:hypothetical protein
MLNIQRAFAMLIFLLNQLTSVTGQFSVGVPHIPPTLGGKLAACQFHRALVLFRCGQILMFSLYHISPWN